MTATLTTPTDAWRWWEARRLRYNIGLALAGWAAWGLFVLESWLALGEVSISVAAVVGQGLFWLVAMGVANVLYLLGPVSESALRPADPEAYRRRMFGLGFWFSMAVPFLLPSVGLVGLLIELGY